MHAFFADITYLGHSHRQWRFRYGLCKESFSQCQPDHWSLIGTSVQCTAEAIAVNFTTRNPFNGRIFVQGMSDRPECVRNYADGGPSAPTPIITFTFGECNMQ